MSNLIDYPYCDKEGFHQGEVLNQVCLESQCKDKFLCCDICANENHKDHKTQPIKILLQEIQKQNDSQNNEFNTQQEQDNIVDYIYSQKENTLSEFAQIQSKIIEEMQKIEKNLSNSFDQLVYNYLQQKSKISSEELQHIIDSIYIDQFSRENFKQKVEQLIDLLPKHKDRYGNNLQIMQSADIIKSIDKYNQQIQKTLLKDQIFQEFQTIESVLNNAYTQKIQTNKIFYQQQLEYLFIKHKNSNQLIVHEEGVEYETKGSTQLIYSEETFTSGQHGYTMEIQNMKTNCSSCFLIGIYTKEDAEANKNTGSHPWACLFNSCRGKMQPGNQNFSNIIKPGDLIKVKLDIQQNTFTIQDELEKLTYYLTPNAYDMKGKSLKFFISFYSADAQVKLRILETY